MERNSAWPQRVLLAQPRGFCAGVVRAIDALKETQRINPGETVYSYHEIIHNTHVVKGFEDSGVKFVNSIDEVPEGSPLVYSAHGVSPSIIEAAERRELGTIDATCPLVKKTHLEARRFLEEGRTVLLIGHAGHDETEGTLGYAPEVKLIEKPEDVAKTVVPDPDKVALIMQTTLSIDDAALIREEVFKRYPNIVTPKKSDICFATQHRQDGVKTMIKEGAEAIVVLGSLTSSNSTRLREVAESHGSKAFFVDEAAQLDPKNFYPFRCVGLTSGASAPEDKFQEIVGFFRSRGTLDFTTVIVAEENFKFEPPKGLR